MHRVPSLHFVQSSSSGNISQPHHSPAAAESIRASLVPLHPALDRRGGSIVQLPGRPLQDAGDLLDLVPREHPVAVIDGVADAGEVSGVVAGPGLGCEDDVFVLRAVGELFIDVSRHDVLCRKSQAVAELAGLGDDGEDGRLWVEGGGGK